MLHKLGHTPGSAAETEWHNTLANAFTATRGTVCNVCGLGGVGHGPESGWLGFERHAYTPIQATPEQTKLADQLSSQAYKQSPRYNNGPCGHNWPSAACNRGECVHTAGHCKDCQ